MAGNTRLLFNNALARATSLTATSAAAGLPVSRLLTSKKGEVWRSTGTSATLDVVLPASELIGAVALPFCNMTTSGTIRVRVATSLANMNAGTYLYDSGIAWAVPAAPEAPVGWGSTVLGANSFAYGGASCARHWMTAKVSGACVRIDLADAGNPAGFIEAGFLVLGDYWEMASNPDAGASVGLGDSDEQYRNGANDLVTEVGTAWRTLSLKLSGLTSSERAKLWSILCSNRRAVPVFISIYPDLSGDSKLEVAHQMLAKLTNTSPVSAIAFTRYGASLEFAEV